MPADPKFKIGDLVEFDFGDGLPGGLGIVENRTGTQGFARIQYLVNWLNGNLSRGWHLEAHLKKVRKRK